MKPLITIHMTPEERAERRHALLQPRPPSPPQPGDTAASYKGLTIEHPLVSENNQKKIFYYPDSLQRLRQAGYDRHLLPAEIFSLLSDGLESKLSGVNADVAKNMVESYGEWTSMAWERKGSVLVAYRDPENLVWNGSDYGVNGTLKHTERKEFAIGNAQSTSWLDLNMFSPEFILYHYGRSFAQLPQEMQAGNRRAQIYLPPEGIIRPVGRGGLGWASRGAKK